MNNHSITELNILAESLTSNFSNDPSDIDSIFELNIINNIIESRESANFN